MRSFLVLLVLGFVAALLFLALRENERGGERTGISGEGSRSPVAERAELREATTVLPEIADESRAPRSSEPGPGFQARWSNDPASKSHVSGVVRRPDDATRRAGSTWRAAVRYVWDEGGRAREVQTLTEDDGSFDLVVADNARGDLVAEDGHYYPVARIGVPANTRGIELELGPPDSLRIEVRNPAGEVLASGPVRCFWQLAGHPIQVLSGPRWNFGDPVWPRSPVPFSVEVSPPEYRTTTVGPLDPARVGPLLVIQVEPLPRLRGRVLHEGKPVVARVGLRSLATDESRAAPLDLSASCDAEGRFELVQPAAGTYELVACAAPAGEGRLGPLELDGVNDVEDLTLELTTPLGSIEGRVLLPPGHGPEEIWLAASSGPGLRTLRADGSFSLPDLPAGPCTVVVLAGIIDPRGGPPGEGWIVMPNRTHVPVRAPDWLPAQPRYTVEVRSGERTRLEIDLVNPPACSLSGAIRIDGAAPVLRGTSEGPDSSEEARVFFSTGSLSDREAAGGLDPRGGFELLARGPGEYQLVVELPLAGGPHEVWKVLAKVQLSEGVAPWSLDVATGSLRVLCDGDVPLASLVAVWRGASGEVRVRFPELDERRESALFHRVPAGRIWLQQGASDAEGLKVEVPVGKLVEVHWDERSTR